MLTIFLRRLYFNEIYGYACGNVGAFFSLENENELKNWSKNFSSVSAKSYMRGYRDIYNDVGLLHKLMIRFCDKLVSMKIVRIAFLD